MAALGNNGLLRRIKAYVALKYASSILGAFLLFFVFLLGYIYTLLFLFSCFGVRLLTRARSLLLSLLIILPIEDGRGGSTLLSQKIDATHTSCIASVGWLDTDLWSDRLLWLHRRILILGP